MNAMPDSEEFPTPSPVSPGESVAGMTVGARFAVRGDIHLHRIVSPKDHVLAVWHYRGAEPLPRFLETLGRDAFAWQSLRASDGQLSLVVPTIDIARIPGSTNFYWIQEAPRGKLLAELLETAPPFAPRYAVDLARQIGTALAQIHEAGLVHGDLDPANVSLAGNKDVPRLAWGGLATRIEGAAMDAGRGTTRALAEVAPEVLLGAPADARSDLYALCALLYRMLAGKPPWLVRRRGPPPGVTASQELPPLPAWVNSPLPELLRVGLQRDPALRPDGVADWLHRLTAAGADLDDAPIPDGTWLPAPVGGPVPAAPTVNRTLSPVERLLNPDAALSNTPLPTASPFADVRSVVPALPRFATPLPISPIPPPSRAVHQGTQIQVVALSLLVVLAVMLALLALGGVSWQLSRPVPPAAVPVAAPAPAVVPTIAALPAPIVAPLPAGPASVTVDTFPSGAAVFEGTSRLGTTPLKVQLKGNKGDPDRVFVLRAEGFEDYTIVQPWSASDMQFVVTLRPAGGKAVSKPPAPAVPVPEQLGIKEGR